MLMYFAILLSSINVKRCGLSIWTNLNPPYPRMLFVKFGWNWLSGSIEKDLFKFVNVFSLFRNYLSLKKGDPSFQKFEIPSFRNDKYICANFGWYCPRGSREEDFLNLLMYFRNFVIISPWKRAGPFIWTNLNPLHPRMLCAKFGWNWLSGSGEEDF